ncbi:LytTR family transcriptional regulator DNA-binding domain-containing protein [Thermoflavifilum aggregans]|uniref:LytTR family transcriptional regulator DNA-binding domain-containing protein n=1 Tax=Thermoflavifilum aggregans TaxID=454188 RepID=UPI000C231A17
MFFVDGKSLLVSKPLTAFEDLLTTYRFFRVSNSHLINLNYINMYLHGTGA